MLIARSAQEALLYLDLQDCDCGVAGFEPEHRLEDRDGVLVSLYDGLCVNCGRSRSYEFVISDEMPPAPPAFGREEPSRIIDPGEFLWICDKVSETTGLRLLNTPLGEQRVHRAGYEYAIAALKEIFKFLPIGVDSVPEELFTSERGREIYRKDPSRFERQELVSNLTHKRRIVNDIDRFNPPREI